MVPRLPGLIHASDPPGGFCIDFDGRPRFDWEQHSGFSEGEPGAASGG